MHTSSTPFLLSLAIGLALTAGTSAASAQGMQVTSSAFADGGRIPATYAGDAAGCGGGGVSPPVAWRDLPAGTKSVAVLLSDPDGGKGLGVSHWVAYNIDAARGGLKEGEAQADVPGVTVGKNVAGAAAYRGMCPPAGDLPHHYTLSVVATDVAPGTLPAGLTHEQLLAALAGHALAGQSVIGLYGK